MRVRMTPIRLWPSLLSTGPERAYGSSQRHGATAPQTTIRTCSEQAHIAETGAPGRTADRDGATAAIRTPNDNPRPVRSGAHRRNRRTFPHPPAIQHAHGATAPQTTIRTCSEQAHIAETSAHRKPPRTPQRPPPPKWKRALRVSPDQPWEASGTSPSWADSKV